jgi:hypothetical protein
MKAGILVLGAANSRSIANALLRAGVEPVLLDRPETLRGIVAAPDLSAVENTPPLSLYHLARHFETGTSASGLDSVRMSLIRPDGEALNIARFESWWSP